MLGHSHSDRRQLGHLTPSRFSRIDALGLVELVRARAAVVGPMLHELIDPIRRKQPPIAALMPALSTAGLARPLTTRPRRRRRRILRWRQRRVPRAPIQTPLELPNTLLEPPVRSHQLIEPKQQTNSRLTITIQDRLGLTPLHTAIFATGPGVPSPPERLPSGSVRASNGTPFTVTIQANGFCSSTLRRVSSGSYQERLRIARIRADLFAIVLCTTPTCSASLSAQVRGLRLVEEKVDPAHRVYDASGPDPRISTIERRRALARQTNDEYSAERRVLVVEVLVANRVCDSRDRRHALTQHKWHRPVVAAWEGVCSRHPVEDYATAGRKCADVIVRRGRISLAKQRNRELGGGVGRGVAGESE